MTRAQHVRSPLRAETVRYSTRNASPDRYLGTCETRRLFFTRSARLLDSAGPPSSVRRPSPNLEVSWVFALRLRAE